MSFSAGPRECASRDPHGTSFGAPAPFRSQAFGAFEQTSALEAAPAVKRKECSHHAPPDEFHHAERDDYILSGQDALDDLTMHIGQTEVASAVAIGQLFVIQSHQVQDGGVQI